MDRIGLPILSSPCGPSIPAMGAAEVQVGSRSQRRRLSAFRKGAGGFELCLEGGLAERLQVVVAANVLLGDEGVGNAPLAGPLLEVVLHVATIACAEKTENSRLAISYGLWERGHHARKKCCKTTYSLRSARRL